MKFTVNIDGQSIEVEIKDPSARPVIAIVEGETFEVYPEENKALVAASTSAAVAKPVLPPSNGRIGANNKNPNVILAPLPGVVVSVAVKAGDSVNVGQEICVVEAMKMKNAIRATRSGTLASVLVSAGQQVNHSDTLAEFHV